MQSRYISYKNSTFHYRKFGNGDKLLFCFHGYGRESDSFYFLQRRLGTIYTIIAIDAPFHGLTNWKDELVVQPRLLVNLINRISNLYHDSQEKFSLLGFSMGGRVALYLTQLVPHRVERLVLIAPDGLSFNFWRWLFSETFIGNKLLAYTIHHAGWALAIINRAENLKVIHRSLADFIRYYIYDEEHRLMLYRRWISMRKFSPRLPKIKQLVRKHSIPVRMLFGAFDRVIPAAGGKRFMQGIEEHASITVVEAGHNLLGELQAVRIADLFTR